MSASLKIGSLTVLDCFSASASWNGRVWTAAAAPAMLSVDPVTTFAASTSPARPVVPTTPLPMPEAGARVDLRGTLVAVHFRDERGFAVFSLELLTVIKRQGEGSPIIEAAHAINHGQLPEARSTPAGDLYILRAKPATEGHRTVLASDVKCPPCNIGPFSTPGYAALAQAAVHTLPNGEGTVFAGQRADGFYVDLGSVFEQLDLRPFQHLHVSPMPDAAGVNGLNRLNVHTIAIQVPMTKLTSDGEKPTDAGKASSVIGIYASASRRKARILADDGDIKQSGPFVQVSRLANPLVNEAMIPIERKDFWNSQPPKDDEQFIEFVKHQEVAVRLVQFYQPAVFPNLAAFNASGKVRDDMVTIFLTGIPGLNQNGGPVADLLRLNMAIPPATSPKLLGVLAGDTAGFPNGRRVFDDVFTIELRALAGVTIKLLGDADDQSFTPDGAAGVITDFSNLATPADLTAIINSPFLTNFPYLGVPYDGFDNPS